MGRVGTDAAASGPSATGDTRGYDAYRRGIDLWRAGELQEALDLLEAVLEGRRGPIDENVRQKLLSRLLVFVSRVSWPDTERLARRAIELYPRHAMGHTRLGEALFQLGRPSEAEAALEKAIALDPEDDEARWLLIAARRGTGLARAKPLRPRPWPDRQQYFDDVSALVERYVLRGYPDRPFITPETVFMAMGSCFADNLAQRLTLAGYEVNYEPIGEEVNSTFANRHLLRWVEEGPVDEPTRVIDEAFGPARRERLARAIRSSRVLVLTLGVAPCFFDRQSGAFVFSGVRSRTAYDHLIEQCVMRTTTVAENVENIREILASVERIAGRKVQVVLTLSPVSIAATTEFYSAVIADCLSKSTLRLACHEVTQERPDLVYWPSFEIVRWLGVHYNRPERPVFGAEDRNTRHVSVWLVDLILDRFIAHHSASSQEPPR